MVIALIFQRKLSMINLGDDFFAAAKKYVHNNGTAKRISVWPIMIRHDFPKRNSFEILLFMNLQNFALSFVLACPALILSTVL